MQAPKHDRALQLVLSPSKVGTYDQCPRKYYYRYIERLPTKPWPHFRLGTFVHGALEYFHRDRMVKTGEQATDAALMKRACEGFYKQMLKDGEAPEAPQIEEARTILQAYLASLPGEGEEEPEILALERKFTMPLADEIGLTGIIDRLDRDPDGVLHIKDYKTNKNARYMKPFQLNVYGLHLLERFPDTKLFRGSYIMLRMGSRHLTYEFTREDVESCRKGLIEKGQRIMEEERWITKPGRLCDWCDFKDVCFNSW